jgi:hypothetical protein
MGTGWIETEVKIEALDIPTMAELDAGAYRAYLEQTLFFVDHHGVFRSLLGEFPIVTSREQLEILIKYLRDEVQPRLER